MTDVCSVKGSFTDLFIGVILSSLVIFPALVSLASRHPNWFERLTIGFCPTAPSSSTGLESTIKYAPGVTPRRGLGVNGDL
jgi:hypothetical protein